MFSSCRMRCICVLTVALAAPLKLGSEGSEPGKLSIPSGLCFVGGTDNILVADSGNDRIVEFSVSSRGGKHIRSVPAGLTQPDAIACRCVHRLPFPLAAHTAHVLAVDALKRMSLRCHRAHCRICARVLALPSRYSGSAIASFTFLCSLLSLSTPDHCLQVRPTPSTQDAVHSVWFAPV